jgi:hypothetical protein
MRRGNKPTFIYDGELLVGVNLGADFCAEHEWGIESLKAAFGIPSDDLIWGIAARQVTVAVKEIQWMAFNHKWYVSSFDVQRGRAEKVGDMKLHSEGFTYPCHDWFTPEQNTKYFAQNSEINGIGLRGAWSGQDFAAVSTEAEDIENLREIYAAFEKMNIVLTFGACMAAFDNAGLIIAIADRIPEPVCKMWFDADRDAYLLQKEFKATRIEELLLKAGKKFLSLRPRRQPDGGLQFWLNPYDQDKTNFGWFTLDDLKAWAEDKGPIPMTPEQEAKRKQAR